VFRALHTGEPFGKKAAARRLLYAEEIGAIPTRHAGDEGYLVRCDSVLQSHAPLAPEICSMLRRLRN
jgi:hypothetical protein